MRPAGQPDRRGVGYIVERVGFVHFFIGTALIGIPVASAAWWLARKGLPALGHEGDPAPR